MRITHLSLENFRNHSKTSIECAPHVNLVTGPNGAGKTSLIDAIHYLCMSRSFVTSSDRYTVHSDEDFFFIKGRFEGEIRSEFQVNCTYSRGEGKKIFVNESPLERISDLIGMVPVVVLSPEDQKLTYEGPVERRAFIDGFISQISPAYLRDLISYRRVRKQRNRLLQEYSGPLSELQGLLDPWNMQLVRAGACIVSKRTEVIENLKLYLEQQFESLSGISLRPGMEYQTFCSPDRDPDAIETIYHQLLEKNFEKEVEREQTLIGPHRDEIVFFLDQKELRKYGSQGQHRLFSVALKLAQLFYYSDELDDLPVMLLDDVFGNLDRDKTEILLKTLQEHPGQTFITSAAEWPFEKKMSDSPANAWFRVENGNVSRRTNGIFE